MTDLEAVKAYVIVLVLLFTVVGIVLTYLAFVPPLKQKLLQTEFNLSKSYRQYRDIHEINYVIPKSQERMREKEIRDMTNQLLSKITRMARDRVLGLPIDEKPVLEVTPINAQTLEDISLCIKSLEAAACSHAETHRAGAIWTVCNGCGATWADDEQPTSVEIPAYAARLKEWVEHEKSKHSQVA